MASYALDPELDTLNVGSMRIRASYMVWRARAGGGGSSSFAQAGALLDSYFLDGACYAS